MLHILSEADVFKRVITKDITDIGKNQKDRTHNPGINFYH